MKTHHVTFVLAILFLTGLFVLWWAGNSDLTPDVSDEVLPGLAKTQVGEIRRIEIQGPVPRDGEGSEGRARRIVLERRDEGAWQVVEPFDAAADPTMAETLARNLKA